MTDLAKFQFVARKQFAVKERLELRADILPGSGPDIRGLDRPVNLSATSVHVRGAPK